MIKLPNQQQQSQNKLNKLSDQQSQKKLNKLPDQQTQNKFNKLPDQQSEMKCSNPNPLLEILRMNSSKKEKFDCDKFKLQSSSLTLSAQEYKKKEHEKIIALFEDE